MPSQVIEVDISTALSTQKQIDIKAILGVPCESLTIQQLDAYVTATLWIGGDKITLTEGSKIHRQLDRIGLTTVGTSSNKLKLYVSTLQSLEQVTQPAIAQYLASDPAYIDSQKGFPRMDSAGNLLIGTSISAGTLVTLAARTSNSQSSDINCANIKSMLLFLYASAKTGTSPTLNVYVEFQDPCSLGWTTQYSFTQLTDITAAPVAVSLTLYGYVYRIRWEIGGTATPGYTFSVGYVAKGLG